MEFLNCKVAAGCWVFSLNNFSQKVGNEVVERAGLEDAERDLKYDLSTMAGRISDFG